MSISVAEVLAGLTFLEIHAPDRYQPLVRACRLRIESERELEPERVRAVLADNLELSIRSLHAILSSSINTVGDLERFMVAHSDEELRSGEWRFRGWGKKATKEVRELLKSLGLEWEWRLP